MLCERGVFATLSFDEKNKIKLAYIDKMNQQYANTSFEEVLKELKVSEPEDIMQFRGFCKTSVSELQVANLLTKKVVPEQAFFYLKKKKHRRSYCLSQQS